MNEQELETLLADRPAPRVTLERIEQVIVGVDYHVFPNTTVTVCLLKLQNGFTVLGESACVNPANFDPEIGKKLAYDNAKNKIWQLEGYLLAQERYEDRIAQGGP